MVRKTVKIEVINNNEAKAENVKIVGSFPTKSEENTMETTITKEIITEGIEANKVKIYYSEKEDATKEITEENGWTEEITDNQKVKSYLIEVEDMEVGESLTATYGLQIPEGLQYNEQAYETYVVNYNDSLTGKEGVVKSAVLGISTGVGPELKATLTAQVGGEELKDGDKVAGGEIITYKVKIENVGTEDATGVKTKLNIQGGIKSKQIKIIDGEKKEVYDSHQGI